MNYSVQVIETRTYWCNYDVEAGDEEEALKKAQMGDTINEMTLCCDEVIDRQILQVGQWKKEMRDE